MIPSINGHDSQTAGSPEGRSSGPCGNAEPVDQCPGGPGPARVPRRALGHGEIRAAVCGSDPPARHASGRPSVTPTWRGPSQSPGESQRPVPLRGDEHAGLPDQVEALPRGREARLEAMRVSFDVAASRRSLSSWFIDRAFDGAPLAGCSYGWPLPWHRSILLKIGARGFVFELWLRRLWITAVDKLSPAYTLSRIWAVPEPANSRPAQRGGTPSRDNRNSRPACLAKPAASTSRSLRSRLSAPRASNRSTLASAP